MPLEIARLAAIVRGMLSSRGDAIARELVSWLAGPATPGQLRPLACVLCWRHSAVVGVSGGGGHPPFFGHISGWSEAGGVEWICADCLERARARLGNPSLDPDMARAESIRALRAAGEEASIARVETAFGSRRILRAFEGECRFCESHGPVAGAGDVAICAPCVQRAIEAAERGRERGRSSEDAEG